MNPSEDYPKINVGEGYATGTLDDLGDGPGFRKVRKGLGVSAFGVNALVLPPGVETGFHYHESQEELYFVHARRCGDTAQGPQRRPGGRHLPDRGRQGWVCGPGRADARGRAGQGPGDARVIRRLDVRAGLGRA